MLKVLLTDVVNPNEILNRDGLRALHIAAGFENEEQSLKVIKLLLQFVSNPNLQDGKGKTCLHYAAQRGHSNCLDLLIYNGGDPLKTDFSGFTPIDDAYSFGFKYCASHLTYLLDSEDVANENEDKFSLFLWKREFIEIDPDSNNLIIYPDFYFTCNSNISSTLKNSIKELYDENQYQLVKKNESLQIDNTTEDIFETGKSKLGHSNSVDLANSGKLMLTNVESDDEMKQFQMHLADCINSIKTDALELKNESVVSQLDVGFIFNRHVSHLLSSISDTDGSFNSAERFCCLPHPSKPESVDEVLNTARSETYSFVTVVEEYFYEDFDRRVQLIEKRCPGTMLLINSHIELSTLKKSLEKVYNSKLNISVSRSLHNSHFSGTKGNITAVPESIKYLSGDELRNNLKGLGFNPGPVVPSTLEVLQKKYFKLRNNPPNQDEVIPKELQICFPSEMWKMFDDQAIFKSSKDLEIEMCRDFTNPERYWRNGNSKNCFNYLLLDPRKTDNLPLRCTWSHSESVNHFKSFISSIIYIGKGTRSRPYQHLYDALPNKRKFQENEKIKAIRSIWNDGLGVISLHIFQNTISVDAHTREACMLSAIGLDNVCNVVKGSFYGPANVWRKSNQRKLGCILLHKAYKIFLAEGERQIRPADLPEHHW